MNYQTPAAAAALPATGVALLNTSLWIVGALALIAAGAALIRIAYVMRRGSEDPR